MHCLISRFAGIVLAALLAGLGCGAGQGEPGPLPPSPVEAARRNGFSVILGQHGRGFLAGQPQSPATGRCLLYLEGTHYEMGFQTGTLCPEGVGRMVHEFADQVIFDLLKIPLNYQDLGPLWDFLRAWLKDRVEASDHLVPQTLREEMRGVADGYEAARREGRADAGVFVTYGDVLLLNLGMDLVSALLYNGMGGLLPGKPAMGCNQFVCWGPHTDDGRLLHGRDFQFPTAGVYQEESLVQISRPVAAGGVSLGNPFISVSAPGFVGQASGLNSRGVSVAIDVVASWAAGDSRSLGLSGLLVNRMVLESAGTLADAVETIRAAERLCPWIYVVADAGNREAVVLETIMSRPPDPWMESRLEQAEALGSALTGEPFPCDFPERGVLPRPADYVLPAACRDKGISFPFWHNDPKFADDHTFLNLLFYDPLEEHPQLLAAANHFLLPEMHAFEWAPVTSLALQELWPDTAWRYQTQVRLLTERSTGGRSLNWETAWQTANFLDPATPEGAFYYGQKPGQAVEGHVLLMDGANLTVRALCGYYLNSHVDVRFRDFLP